MSTCKCASVGPLRIKDQEALIARCPNFSRVFHTDRGMVPTQAQIVGCLRWTGGGGCAMVHGDGPASGQAGLDRQDKPQNADMGRGVPSSKSSHRS